MQKFTEVEDVSALLNFISAATTFDFALPEINISSRVADGKYLYCKVDSWSNKKKNKLKMLSSVWISEQFYFSREMFFITSELSGVSMINFHMGKKFQLRNSCWERFVSTCIFYKIQLHIAVLSLFTLWCYAVLISVF